MSSLLEGNIYDLVKESNLQGEQAIKNMNWLIYYSTEKQFQKIKRSQFIEDLNIGFAMNNNIKGLMEWSYSWNNEGEKEHKMGTETITINCDKLRDNTDMLIHELTHKILFKYKQNTKHTLEFLLVFQLLIRRYYHQKLCPLQYQAIITSYDFHEDVLFPVFNFNIHKLNLRLNKMSYKWNTLEDLIKIVYEYTDEVRAKYKDKHNI